MTALTVEGIGKEYGSHVVLDDVTLAVPEGRCLALIGHNGAGKTTLMKLVLGLVRPTRGSVQVLGTDPSHAGKLFRKQIGFLPENVSFHDELTGSDTLGFYARLKGASVAETRRLMDLVGLADAGARRVKTYSKGMRQRLGLAQALLNKPKLLLLDEPTTGLDPVLRQLFFQIIHELKVTGTTVILSSHILTELEARTDLVAIMREGRLVAFGDIEALRHDAGLPVAVRVKGDAAAVSRKLNGEFKKSLAESGETIDIECPATKKMALLRTIAELGGLCADVEVRMPSLDDLYLHYSGRPISVPSASKCEALR